LSPQSWSSLTQRSPKLFPPRLIMGVALLYRPWFPDVSRGFSLV
jgi:hypothetical protein